MILLQLLVIVRLKMKYFLSFILVFILSACGHLTPVETVVTKTEVIHTSIPNSLLKDCSVTKPPSKVSYLAMDYAGKEDALSNYIINLLKDLKLCNTQLSEIRNYQIEQKEILQ